ncbi:TlpA family protein disulfide reductase [Actinobacteria bacterium YIM 96077]|uniref:TlpA family protein disulfide reductase n=1 Tax=Phytoactinopolyspora halophila TaxID=1981511 RepID=A0A329QMW7_9ACTN|nr:TlpA disulfide reductase family protein [Phytoactinopolyspora halophila]AYY14805.1 TlpA family protein disulfide reductase [Actinobacteria bacterium YIM 96077]RAW13079.1 TlpA family protein disulfide reductase [Phytoactinopolyspora halophila]
MRRLGIVAGMLVVLVAGCSDGQVTREASEGQEIGYIEGDGTVSMIAPEDRDPAPEFGGPILGEDDEFYLSDAEGDVIVVNVWGSWCPPCRKEAPDLQAVHEEMADEGVQFLGVNTRDGQSETAALAFEEEFGITYPSIVDPHGERLLAFRDTLPPAAIPSTLVIDREGRIAARVLGPIGQNSLQDMVADIASETPREGSGDDAADT